MTLAVAPVAVRLARTLTLLGVLLIGTAQAAPAVDALLSHCAAGAPTRDVAGQPLPGGLWQRGAVLAVFWSVDCAFCQRHNERLNRLLQAEPAAVIGVAVDGDAATVAATAKKRGYRFPVIADGTGGCSLRAQLTPRKLVPMTCWIGVSPTQPRCIPGEMSEDDLRGLLRQARVE